MKTCLFRQFIPVLAGWFVSFIALTMVSGALAADKSGKEENIRPGINEYYKNPHFETWKQRFESRGREVYDRRHEIVRELAIRRGMAIADVGAGTGLFTLMFARKTGSTGKVYAVDISRVFVDNVLRRSKAEGFANVVGIVNTQRSTRLKPGSVDLVFISDTYHHFEYPRSMLSSIHQALKPGGTLVVIDFRKQPGVSSAWVMQHVRAGRKTVIREITSAGFQLERDSKLLRINYFLTFTKAKR